MDVTETVFGTWSGGRFMHFGECIEEDRWVELVRTAYESGIRTFATADVYGVGRSEELLATALSDYERETYCLVGMVGHDIYDGKRAGVRGYARFTLPDLRGPEGYAEYLKRATERSLERCQTDYFDLVMLHNPDSTGYSSPAVWEGMRGLKTAGLTRKTGVAPGPANGFAIDMAYCFEQFHEDIDWAMIILNPMEPWPGRYILPIANEFDIKLLTRVVDYGGMFHDDVKPGHLFNDGDHRTYRVEGWIEQGAAKMEKMRPIADRHGLSMLQLSACWNLSQTPVMSVAPTFIQEAGDSARPVEDKVRDLAGLPDVRLSHEEVEEIFQIGNNEGCMKLKGASSRNAEMEPQPDRWPMRPELQPMAARWGLNPDW
ncbi:MAG: aldo/keto reductase [Verrucomicrobiota bacterium]